MIESIGLAAGQFALEYVGRQWWDWRKRRQLAKAYRQSAEETIDRCARAGYHSRSPVWDSVVSLLRSEERARQVAGCYAQGQTSSKDLQDVIGDDPTVGHFIRWFIVRLNDRCANLLPPEQKSVVDIISRRMALLGQQTQIGAPNKPAELLTG